MANCCVLVNSCDKYEDAWHPFFSLLKKYWNDCPYKIYLNTETKTYCMEGIEIESINLPDKLKTKKCAWSLRLKYALKRIKAKYVIFLLEDFFLLDYVNQKEIEKTISWLENNKDISCFQFYPNPKLLCENDRKFMGYQKRSMKGRWWLRCQAAVWRKKDLLRYLNPYESAWQFEEYGTHIAKLYNKRFYNCCDEKLCPFSYNVDIYTGYGIYEGEWLKSNVDLFKKENIEVDFSKLGFYEGTGAKPFICYPSRKTVKEKLVFLLHGTGDERYFISFKEQLKLLFVHPIRFFRLVKIRFLFLFSNNYRKKM